MLLSPALAQAEAARILFSLNRVEIQRGTQTLPALRGAPLDVGDTLNTGPNGYAQLRFKDGALLSLKPGGSIKIEEFALPKPATAAPAAVAPSAGIAPARASAISSGAASGGRSVLRLLRGAFRTITGAIGKNASDVYRVVTPTATIGIRGTDYSVALCSGDCSGSANGLYLGVSNGEITVTNDAGQIELGNNQYGYVKDSTTPPEQQIAPPEVLETPIAPEAGDGSEDEKGDEPAAEAQAGFDAGSTEEYAAPPEGDSGGIEASGENDALAVTEYTEPETPFELPPVRPLRSFAFATGPFPPQSAFAGVRNAEQDGDFFLSGNDELIRFSAGNSNNQLVSYSIGASQVQNLGFDLDTGLRWGRWSGGADAGGQTISKPLHWIFGPQTFEAPVLPISGTLTYTLVGNTNPTDNNGNVGFLGDATFTANFSAMTVNSTLRIGFGDAASPASTVWIANSTSGNISAGTNLFGGAYGVTVNNAAGSTIGSGNGVFAGFFTPDAAGVGLGYSLTDNTTTVSGAAAFGNPAAGSGP